MSTSTPQPPDQPPTPAFTDRSTTSFASTTDTPFPTSLPTDPSETQARELADLVARATAKYAVKDYGNAAELYSRAVELQAEMNGEMATQNADLLYLYGRCLYHVAVSGSDVLGGKVAGDGKAEGGKKRKRVEAEEVPTAGSSKEVAGVEKGAGGEKKSTPYFQISGDDEGWNEDDEDGEAEGEGEGEAQGEEEEGDDFSNAFEVLDLARVLLGHRLEEAVKASREVILDQHSEEGKAQTINSIKERLADTHDLQAEIALEAERWSDAVSDLRAALALKEQLYPSYSSLISENHFKLSLALEYASLTEIESEENGASASAGRKAKVDMKTRNESAQHMDKAIESCKKRIEIEEKALAEGKESEVEVRSGARKTKITRESIDEVKEIVGEMEQRLAELKVAPVNVNEAAKEEERAAIGGILAEIMGLSPEEQKAKFGELAKTANDLSSVIKKKPKTAPALGSATNVTATPKTNGEPATSPAQPVSSGEKRKHEDEVVELEDSSKKPKTEE